MTAPELSGTVAVVVTTYDAVARARSTVGTVLSAGQASCLVVDVDGNYRPVADEAVMTLVESVTHLQLEAEARIAAATLEPQELLQYAGIVGASVALNAGCSGAWVLGAGLVVLDGLDSGTTELGSLLVVPRLDAQSSQRRATAGPLYERRKWPAGLPTMQGAELGSLYSRNLFFVHDCDAAATLRELAADWRIAERALEIASVTHGCVIAGDELLINPWRALGVTALDTDGHLCVDGIRVKAVDLTALDPRRPWILDPHARTSPQVLLSEHPDLARLTAVEANARIDDEAGLDISPPTEGSARRHEPPRIQFDAFLRGEARRLERTREDLPDLLGLGHGIDPESWALALVPEGSPHAVARYLAAVRMARPRLQQQFRQVPGVDTIRLAEWAKSKGSEKDGVHESLLTRSARVTLAGQSDSAVTHGPLAPGVNVVGYLAGEMGLGESARLVDGALRAAGVETSTFDVSGGIRSRLGARFRESAAVVRETSLLCVNGAELPAVMRGIGDQIHGSRVVGMWYWELEEFPSLHHIGFRHVDEVWAATDFMRDAIARHSAQIPVRTVTPPLPQADTNPGALPARFGIPHERPWFLFTFDFLSQANRKNPYGLVEAFIRAFGDQPSPQQPVLVIKSINADKQPAQAERLRLQVAGRLDVLLLDTYLDHDERHVLVANCTCFVSLHKAEGLGLTIAEAMAWGKPVIVTAYGGVMQFCNDRNAFLVDWTPGQVDETTGPYKKGMTWAEPDLDQAAEFMRLVIDSAADASARGQQAARDIRELHNAEVAGARMREVLEEGAREWRDERPSPGAASAPQDVRSRWAARVRRRAGASWNRWRSGSG